MTEIQPPLVIRVISRILNFLVKSNEKDLTKNDSHDRVVEPRGNTITRYNKNGDSSGTQASISKDD